MIVTLAWRNVWRNKLRSSIMVAAMVFGLLGVVLMVGFIQAMTESMIENAIKYQTAHFQVHNPDFLINEELAAWLPGADDMANRLREMEGVGGVAVRQVIDGMVSSAASNRGVRINGVDMAEEVKVTDVAQSIIEGEPLPEEGRNPVMVSKRSGEKLNLRIGSKVVLTFSDVNGEVSGAAFRVSGFFDTPSSGFDEANVFVRRSDLVKYTGLEEAHEVVIRFTDGENLEQHRPTVEGIVGDVGGERGKVRDWGEVQPLLAAMMGSLDISNMITIVIFVLAMGFGIVNVMLMSVFERTREFGVLISVGMTGKKVLGLIVLESLMLGGVGGLLGLVVGMILITITGKLGMPIGAVAEGMGFYGVDTVLYPRVPISTYLIMMAMILLTSLLASLYPARQILKKRPSEALAEKH